MSESGLEFAAIFFLILAITCEWYRHWSDRKKSNEWVRNKLKTFTPADPELLELEQRVREWKMENGTFDEPFVGWIRGSKYE